MKFPVFAAFVTLTLLACSGSGSDGGVGSSSGATTGASSGGGGNGGGGGHPCPEVGYKMCPNDEPFSASDVNVCKLCSAEWQAASACGEQLHGSCGADGKKSVPTVGPCGDQVLAYIDCAFRTIGRDAGAGD